MNEAIAGRRTMVFSPHYDDETLGCGGTILHQRRTGAEVTIVYVTDGGQSHARWMAPAALSRLRSIEGREAANVLGVGPADVVELGFPELSLHAHSADAAAAVVDVLRERRPLEVFVPYRLDPPADHRATTDIVLAALRRADMAARVFEYPIWAWNRWPWTAQPRRRRAWRVRWRQWVKFNARFLRDLRVRVDVEPHLSGKREALACHRTQMTRVNGDPTWPTLADVAQSGFLDCFFERAEFFAASRVDGTTEKRGR